MLSRTEISKEWLDIKNRKLDLKLDAKNKLYQGYYIDIMIVDYSKSCPSKTHGYITKCYYQRNVTEKEFEELKSTNNSVVGFTWSSHYSLVYISIFPSI